MPSFDIVKEISPSTSFRVMKVKSDFDIRDEHVSEHFRGEIIYPEQWNIGVIVGGSGTGKSSIAKHLFPDDYIERFNYSGKSVIDDMPDVPLSDVEKMFYSVGFGSVPSWLKPYSILSTGEKMRVDLARALLLHDFCVLDEFTSVVDRNVANTACLALHKAMRRNNKKIVVVSCHYDILDWLSPDWVFDTNTMTSFFGIAHDQKNISRLENAQSASGQSLGDITI